MDRKYLEKIETIDGTGELYNREELVGTVRYSIDVLLEKIESRTSTGITVVDGLKETRGIVRPTPPFAPEFTLLLQDGRRLNIGIENWQTGAFRGLGAFRHAQDK